MPGDNQTELTQYGLENMFLRLEKNREKNKIRAVKYRQRKKQEEQQCLARYHMVSRQNMNLWREVQELKRENEQLSANLAQHKTYCQQLAASLAIHQSHCTMEGNEYHMYTKNNEYWSTSKREEDEEQPVINEETNNGALMVVQEDDQTVSDGDMINNQEINSDEASMHIEDWVSWFGS